MLTRRLLLTAVSALAIIPSAVLSHHGWGTFDTSRAFYLRGTVTAVRWGNPHSEVEISVDATSLPADLRARPLPPGADEDNGQATMASARPYEGGADHVHLILAGPGWMSRWGLDRPLAQGEVIEAVGYLNADQRDVLRPVMFWTGDGQGVWQQLTAFPVEPQPAE